MHSLLCCSLSPAPPLTFKNVLKAVERMRNWKDLCQLFGIYASALEDVVDYFVRGRGPYQPSWRRVIFSLDEANETHLADQIRSYGEPVQGEMYVMWVNGFFRDYGTRLVTGLSCIDHVLVFMMLCELCVSECSL